jgi:hypothetical protein
MSTIKTDPKNILARIDGHLEQMDDRLGPPAIGQVRGDSLDIVWRI